MAADEWDAKARELLARWFMHDEMAGYFAKHYNATKEELPTPPAASTGRG